MVVEYTITPAGCWECTSGTPGESGHHRVYHGGRMRPAHHVTYEEATGAPVPAGLLLRHTCDNPPCVNPAHLIPGTDLENVADRVGRGRSARGERNGAAKLTADRVRLVRRSSLPTRALARELGVCPRAIRKVRQWITWKHV